MAIPSGSGTEVLKRITLHANNNAYTEVLSGTANHIYTILSIIFHDEQGVAGTIGIRVNDGSNDIFLINGQSHGADETFVWNDKFVLTDDDDLDVYNSVTNGDWYISYIDQDWS